MVVIMFDAAAEIFSVVNLVKIQLTAFDLGLVPLTLIESRSVLARVIGMSRNNA